jgi:membrane carboxypeptidase/penicillin-binding protein
MMQSVVNEGTGGIIRTLGFEGPAAGKTGTTDDYTDNWYVGFTPDITCGVWVGFDKKKPVFQGATGGSVAAPVWADLMKTVKPDSGPAAEFAMPDSITTAPVCELSGKLATPACPRVHYEVFIAGSEPTTPCDIHRR